MHMDNEEIIFIVRRDAEILGIFKTVGSAIKGAEHLLKGDSHGTVDVIINVRDIGDHIARVTLNDNEVKIFAILFDDNHSIDGVNVLNMDGPNW